MTGHGELTPVPAALVIPQNSIPVASETSILPQHAVAAVDFNLGDALLISGISLSAYRNPRPANFPAQIGSKIVRADRRQSRAPILLFDGVSDTFEPHAPDDAPWRHIPHQDDPFACGDDGWTLVELRDTRRPALLRSQSQSSAVCWKGT